ncbi:Glyoxylase, beta-lactamase superfamily II [Jatrophihabitans endophyticus]|uniref:Glyoxylase, beta-lactamase superfamily II n=1 Tax=Jatrophihabitans endophyticus TaxID=1206085 RepID=A0A1M5RTU6_9ACTN|nr:MBL fold metallo-hydrolase [Jatrophihabitans endophyticus]SHH29478.1 Glyoxylase, beta-lactamase superfamily II [Jatrophihabitans endophyticus]
MRTDMVAEVADGVFLARGTDVNWVLLREGKDVTLVDTGWAGDRAKVLASVAAVGVRPEDVRAILLTHAHIDHMGAVNHFHTSYGTPVYLDEVEVAHARREYLEQAGPGVVIRNLGRRGVLGWALRVARVGATRDITVAHARRLPAAGDDGALDLPGRPVPVPMHGHTSGHSAFHLPAAGVVITGDGLVTGHPATGVDGPHVLGGMFDHSPTEALAALDALAGLGADVVLPGHGPAYRGPVATAVTIARQRATGGATPPG